MTKIFMKYIQRACAYAFKAQMRSAELPSPSPSVPPLPTGEALRVVGDADPYGTRSFGYTQDDTLCQFRISRFAFRILHLRLGAEHPRFKIKRARDCSRALFHSGKCYFVFNLIS